MSASATNSVIFPAQDEKNDAIAVRPDSGSLMSIIERLALRKDLDISKMKELLDLKERWDKEEARKAYHAAKADFKAFAITITKDKNNSQYASKYVSLGNLVSTVIPFLSKCGLEHAWQIDQSTSGQIKVTCTLTHHMGHSESVTMSGPPDSSGQKNPIQQIKSTITYLKAVTFESVCGLASTDANLDDDGNGTSEQWIQDYISHIEESADEAECDRRFREAYRKASDVKNQAAQKAFILAKDGRKKVLKCK